MSTLDCVAPDVVPKTSLKISVKLNYSNIFNILYILYILDILDILGAVIVGIIELVNR